MRDEATTEKLRAYGEQIKNLRRQMHETLRAAPPEPVRDYAFATLEGPVTLSALFGDKDDLFVVHNMGCSCVACTLWADGYNGLVPHLESRASFVVSSPDDPATQRAFGQGRGWRFRMVSLAGNGFAADMGFQEEARYRPGVSVFRRGAEGIARVSDAALGPYDEFCAVWHLFDLLPGGTGDWRPKFSYAA